MPKLFQRMLLIFSLIFGVSILVISCAAGWFSYKNLINEYRSKGIAIAQGLADSSVDTILNSDPSSLQALINQFKDIEGVAYIMVETHQNKHYEVIAHTFIPEIPSTLLNHTHSNPIKRFDISSFHPFFLPEIGSVIHISMPILEGEIGHIYIGMALKPIYIKTLEAFLKVALLCILVSVVSLFVVYWMLQKIAQPLKTFTQLSKKLVDQNFTFNTDQAANLHLLTSTKDEIGELALSFEQMQTQLQNYLVELEQSTAEREKIQNELRIAASIQLEMLPQHPSLELPHSSFFGLLKPAKDISGDFYNIVHLEHLDRVYFIVGDVAGKGITASLVMAKCATLFKALLQQSLSPEQLITSLNKQLCENNSNSMFTTVFLGYLHTPTGELTYCNAGHPNPFLINAEGVISELESTENIPLGIEPTYSYASKTITLPSQSTCILYTDGVQEAEKEDHEEFGFDRLKAVLKRTVGDSPETICNTIQQEVLSYSNTMPQHDDITLLGFQWKEPEHRLPNPLSVFFQNDINELVKVQQVLDQCAEVFSLSTKAHMNLNLILEELISNIIFYAYTDHEPHVIYLNLSFEAGSIKGVIQDDGIAFNPLEAPKVDTSTTLEEKNIGGLGIHLIRNMTKELSYKRQDPYNFLEFSLDA